MASITLKDFNGMNLKEGLWDQAYSLYNYGGDFYGLGDNVNQVSFPGVLQAAWPLSAMGISATTTLGGVIADFARFSVNNSIYALDSNTPNSAIYSPGSLAGTLQWRIQNGVGGANTITVSGVGSNLCEYASKLFYSSTTNIGYFDGAASNANYQSISNTPYPVPMKVFSGSLMIGISNQIDKYDGSTYSAKKLVLPAGFNIRSMEVFRDYLYISADNGQYSKVFLWDGASPTYNETLSFLDERYGPSLCASGEILWIVGNRGIGSTSSPSFLTPIYAYQYGLPELVFNLPMNRTTAPAANNPMHGIAIYQSGILIASTESSSTATYEGGVAGLWYVNKKQGVEGYQASLLFTKPTALTNLTLGGVYSGGAPNQFYSTNQPPITVGAADTSSGTTYQILGVTQTAAKAVYYTLPIDAASTTRKNWISIRANLDSLLTGQTVTILYRLDDTTSFTTLKTFAATDPSTNRFARIPIGRTSRTITFQIQLATTGTNFTPRFHSMTIYYEPNEA